VSPTLAADQEPGPRFLTAVIRTRPAVEVVVLPVPRKQIVSSKAKQNVIAMLPMEFIVAFTAHDPIAAIPPPDVIPSRVAVELLVVAPIGIDDVTEDVVVLGASMDGVGIRATADRVGTGIALITPPVSPDVVPVVTALQGVFGAVASDQAILAALAIAVVPAGSGVDLVVPATAADVILALEAADEVVARTGHDGVSPVGAFDPVISGSAPDDCVGTEARARWVVTNYA
jgi:hypothetical protein